MKDAEKEKQEGRGMSAEGFTGACCHFWVLLGSATKELLMGYREEKEHASNQKLEMPICE